MSANELRRGDSSTAGLVARRRMTSAELTTWRSLVDTTAELRRVLGAELQETTLSSAGTAAQPTTAGPKSHSRQKARVSSGGQPRRTCGLSNGISPTR